MAFLKSIFKKKNQVINSNQDFWSWFVKNEKIFHKVVKEHTNINEDFFNKLSPKLQQLKGDIWFLTGMFDKQTAELILTADGSLKNIAFVEELMEIAPVLQNWKLTCLKQPLESNRFAINMNGYKFDETTMSFYSIDHPEMPDEIDIVITHKDLNEKNVSEINSGVYLSLDNALGEINSISSIDNLEVINPADAEFELINLEKLPSFLKWRKKEFIEKYDGVRIDTKNHNFTVFQGNTGLGLPTIATINSDLLEWDKKASHSWIGVALLKFNGKNNNGMPNEKADELMQKIEDELLLELKDSNGYLYIGRETTNGLREIYFTCVDFRLPSKVFYHFKEVYTSQIELDYDIYKDKYWRSFNRYRIA